MVGLSHIAKRAGVSVSTASRALAGYAHVAPDTSERIRRIAQELGYEPNTLARGLRRNQTRMIGLLLADTRGSSFSSDVWQLLHRQLHEFGYGLMLCANLHDRESERRYLEILPQHGISGLFHLPLAKMNAEALMTSPSPIPVIEFLRCSGSTKIDGVIHDEVMGSIRVVEHLVQLGHRRIGIIAGPQRIGSTEQRIEGVRRAFDFAGIDQETAPIVYAEHSMHGGQLAFTELMQKRPRVTAIYAAGAQLALGAVIAANENRIKIPEQVSLIGLGNPTWGQVMTPQLTTFTLPLQEMAMTAALLMISRIENDAAQSDPVQITLSGRVLVRESCAPPNE